MLQRIVTRTDVLAEEYVALECERLDVALLAIAAKVQAGEIDAVHAWVRLCESRRKLLGLDAPARLEWMKEQPDDVLRAIAGVGAFAQ